MKSFIPFVEREGYDEVVKIGRDTKYIGLGLLNLSSGQKFKGETKDKEVALIILSGKCDVKAGDLRFSGLGKRKDVFSGKATAVYLPVDTEYEVENVSEGTLEIAVVLAVSQKKYAPFVIRPEDVFVSRRGTTNCRRYLHEILAGNVQDKVDRIIVGEIFTYKGNWGSYPPHKHDEYNPPIETEMEEIYHFKINPKEGFGVQLIYNDDLSVREAYFIKDGDTAVIREGYHPVAAAPGFKIYYLWAMAGPYGRRIMSKEDQEIIKALK